MEVLKYIITFTTIILSIVKWFDLSFLSALFIAVSAVGIVACASVFDEIIKNKKNIKSLKKSIARVVEVKELGKRKKEYVFEVYDVYNNVKITKELGSVDYEIYQFVDVYLIHDKDGKLTDIECELEKRTTYPWELLWITLIFVIISIMLVLFEKQFINTYTLFLVVGEKLVQMLVWSLLILIFRRENRKIFLVINAKVTGYKEINKKDKFGKFITFKKRKYSFYVKDRCITYIGKKDYKDEDLYKDVKVYFYGEKKKFSDKKKWTKFHFLIFFLGMYNVYLLIYIILDFVKYLN